MGLPARQAQRDLQARRDRDHRGDWLPTGTNGNERIEWLDWSHRPQRHERQQRVRRQSNGATTAPLERRARRALPDPRRSIMFATTRARRAHWKSWSRQAVHYVANQRRGRRASERELSGLPRRQPALEERFRCMSTGRPFAILIPPSPPGTTLRSARAIPDTARMRVRLIRHPIKLLALR